MPSSDPPPPVRVVPDDESVAGEEDPGAAIEPRMGHPIDEAAPRPVVSQCPRCGGSGRLEEGPCPDCGGTRRATQPAPGLPRD